MTKMSKHQATLKEVAELAGVSVSSVSKIITNNTKFSFKQETVDKVKWAAKELNYNPNILARGMVGGNSPVIGFFMPNILNPFFAEVVNIIEEYLRHKGYLLILCLFNDDPVLMNKYLKYLMEIRAIGAIIGSSKVDECNEAVLRAGQFMSIVSFQSDIPGIDLVDTNNVESGYEIIHYLLEKGHRNIGFLGYRYDMAVMGGRLEGYKRALAEYKVPYRQEYVPACKHSSESAYSQTIELLKLENRPTAIFCANEFLATFSYRAIYDYGLSIPEDISVASMDNMAMNGLIPPITTMAQPIREMSLKAVDLLIDRIQKKKEEVEIEPRKIIIKSKLIERDSVNEI